MAIKTAATLLERERELAELSRVLDEVHAGNGRAVVIEAPAGLGKTTLLGAVAEQVGPARTQDGADRRHQQTGRRRDHGEPGGGDAGGAGGPDADQPGRVADRQRGEHRGATAVDLSQNVEEAVERGWVYATLKFGASQVRTGHLLVGGSDPVQALRDWGARVGYVHLKDARLDIVRAVVEDGAGALEAWRRGVFCELGTGDVDLDAFLDALRATGYDGWLCVEQDRIPRDDEPLSESAEAQVRNREWLRARGL